VAEGTAEIAPAGEHRAGHLAGKIQQRQLLQTAQFHPHPSQNLVPYYSTTSAPKKEDGIMHKKTGMELGISQKRPWGGAF
jgi:hypothetical protein